MKVQIEEHVDATIVKAQGRIDIGVGDIQLRNCLYEVAREEENSIILDMQKIHYMDSAGVGELVEAHKYLERRGIRLILSNLNAKIYGLLDLTRLITIFSVYDSNEDALQSLTSAAV